MIKLWLDLPSGMLPILLFYIVQVEHWFGFISQRAIQRGSFRNVGELVQKSISM